MTENEQHARDPWGFSTSDFRTVRCCRCHCGSLYRPISTRWWCYDTKYVYDKFYCNDPKQQIILNVRRIHIVRRWMSIMYVVAFQLTPVRSKWRRFDGGEGGKGRRICPGLVFGSVAETSTANTLCVTDTSRNVSHRGRRVIYLAEVKNMSSDLIRVRKMETRIVFGCEYVKSCKTRESSRLDDGKTSTKQIIRSNACNGFIIRLQILFVQT